ncbi:MAG: methionyl-tRNA formyltransferase [Bacteroidales bacterium]|nr:methionyl-tRNA formyltransferase [Bacteroidales bacterium]MCF8456029.1 methionyl-tRNA formyltransferase [Bacteroidales bacterium]
MMKKEEFRIVFMGTPDFAVESLRVLVENGYNVVGVITNVDKPAGRGRKVSFSAVKEYALEKDLTLLQPPNLKAPEFVEELRNLKPDLGIIVAFRMLPEVVWGLPRFGTVNLHASLLPQYRGAAPINWAIINGEMETGLTTFFLQHEIDTGKIIFQEKLPIAPDENAGQLHDRLMKVGGELIKKTVDAIVKGDYPQMDQSGYLKEGGALKTAPKIFKDDCRIDWPADLSTIYNHIRGLSPYPAAWTELKGPDGDTIQLKIYSAEQEIEEHKLIPVSLLTDSKTLLKVAVQDGFISITELQQAGKKRMLVGDFLRGFSGIENYRFE